MKKISKLSLARLGKEDLTDREMSQVRGGNNCGCGCQTSSKEANYSANWTNNLYSGGGNIICSWEGTGFVYGGSKAPYMP